MSPQQYVDFVNKYGSANTTVLGTVGYAYNSLDSVLYPTKGTIHAAGAELSTPVGDLKFYKLNYKYQRYVPLSKDFTLYMSGEAGYGNGYSGDELPFYKNFYAGGMGTIRGYQTASLGPRVVNADGSLSDQRTGGNRRIAGSVELLFPLPGLGLDKSLRLGPFVDAAQVWGQSSDGQDVGPIRFTTGLSAIWTSPMGPLKFAVGTPLNKQSGDKLQAFQFQMGQSF